MIEKNKFPDQNIPATEKKILRELAKQAAEIAVHPLQAEKRELWYHHNALEPTRPLVFCDPENGWLEIVPPVSLACKHALARNWENRLRMEIFWGSQMQDDRVSELWFDIPHSYTDTGWGMAETIIGGGNGGSFTWDAPLTLESDFQKLHFPQILIDENQTNRSLEAAVETFDGLLDVRLKTNWWWSLGMTRTLINLRGLTRSMLDMADKPGFVHRLMAFFRDGTLAMLDYLEQQQLLYLNNDGTYVGSGGFGWSRELPQKGFSGNVKLADMWGFSESQETVGISPRMFKDFIFDYQLPILERFGLNCYGCCEPVDKRWRYLAAIPNLRRISISPWSSLEGMAELLGDRYIFSMKPHPGPLAEDHFDEEQVRMELRRALQITRGCRVEVVMKDNHTIRGDPGRVIRWVKIAKEEAEKM